MPGTTKDDDFLTLYPFRTGTDGFFIASLERSVSYTHLQVPGGMLSNLLKQLKDAGKEDQLDAVLQEIPRVRKDRCV